ncbi:lysozyme inhibitor LprI family protein [uncultured Microbulbifer sp.]|uniref:lysozyme inhibitor LprI family protein n=1 Tax=uncultured Microbulbifer sp. TaxID=348147 RepID=UPI0026024F66|nr:lysozyme inhibitor LprI family protein [uncultured Microbulbifer sp.]
MKYFLILTSILSINSYAASFDCSKASTKIEHAICSNTQLSELDDKLSASFSGLKVQLEKSDFQILLREQRKWIKQRANSCEGSKRINKCLVRTYENRLNTLDIFSMKKLPPLTDLDAICSGKSKRNTVNEKLFDINNDGANEVAEQCRGGTMNNPCMNFKDLNGERISLRTIGFEWNTYWTRYSSYFEYNGKVYNSHETDKGPSHIRYTTPENHSYVVCEFENIESEKFHPTQESSVSSDICSLAGDKKLQYISLNDKPQITRKQIREVGRYETGIERQGYLDVNNDGGMELVAQVDYASGAGRGCDFLYYDELNIEDGTFKNTKGQTPLLKMQGVNLDYRHPNCGGMNNSLFRHDGKIYYEINTRKEHRISILEGDQIRNICDVKRSVETNVKYIGPPNK